MSGPRILCIEDNAMNWRLVQRLLSEAGYEMHWADDGLKGCEAAAALKPALILLDINLPGLSGFEVATKLRQNRDLDATLIIALTAKTMRSDRETALVTGCDGFISKPIDPFLFVGQVEAYLGGRRDRLEQGREGEALRQFSQKVVEHLEAQLREAQESNRKLLEAQSALEQRSHHLSRLLALSKEIIPLREEEEIVSRVLGRLREDQGLDHLSLYRFHPSGTYLHGLAWKEGAFAETAVLPGTHPLAGRAAALPLAGLLLDADLRQTAMWEQGIDLGLWDPRNQALFLPLRSRSQEGGLWGFLAADRGGKPFQAFEAELVALHAGLLHVSLENADLIAHLDETSLALGTSYEGLESAHEALKEAQRALGAKDRKAALGELFMRMAQRLQQPVTTLKAESQAMSVLINRTEGGGELHMECRRAMNQIHRATTQVESLFRALLRRAGQGETSTPEWIHLHELLRQEVELSRAESGGPAVLSAHLNFQASRDLLYGVYTDFSEALKHLLAHARGGEAGPIRIRTWGGNRHFRLEVEDEGGPIRPEDMEQAFEPFSALRGVEPGPGRRPGKGLPHCAQLMSAYGGSVVLEPSEGGTRVRISLPME